MWKKKDDPTPFEARLDARLDQERRNKQSTYRGSPRTGSKPTSRSAPVKYMGPEDLREEAFLGNQCGEV